MRHNVSPTELPAWKALTAHAEQAKDVLLRDLFAANAHRFESFSIELDDLLFDYSKQRVTEETIRLLVDLATEARLGERIAELFAGAPVNQTENRSVLHMALRASPDAPFQIDGRNLMPIVLRTREKMKGLADAIGHRTLKGHSGDPLTSIVNIGIGGSDLGPAMATEGLRPYWRDGLSAHFVSNVDPAHLTETLAHLDARHTLFIVSSKTFTTQETLLNAHAARRWLVSRLGEGAVEKHFVAVTANAQAASALGMAADNVFEMWDWVGGRFSLWSAIGLPVACAIGMDRFNELLDGGREVDEHFRAAPFERNVPVMMALVGIWCRNFLGIGSHAIVPYCQALERFPAFLQQLEMESNGKSVDQQGKPVAGYATAPVLWGAPGTNAQHAFFQLLHQGTDIISADFIAPVQSHCEAKEQHAALLSNCFAQTEALMMGRQHQDPTRAFSGNRPTSTILFDKLTPRALGRLIALYEHKVFVQGTLWNIHSFDQWGVELGKELANGILPELSGAPASPHDGSTAGLVARVKARG